MTSSGQSSVVQPASVTRSHFPSDGEAALREENACLLNELRTANQALLVAEEKARELATHLSMSISRISTLEEGVAQRRYRYDTSSVPSTPPNRRPPQSAAPSSSSPQRNAVSQVSSLTTETTPLRIGYVLPSSSAESPSLSLHPSSASSGVGTSPSVKRPAAFRPVEPRARKPARSSPSTPSHSAVPATQSPAVSPSRAGPRSEASHETDSSLAAGSLGPRVAKAASSTGVPTPVQTSKPLTATAHAASGLQSREAEISTTAAKVDVTPAGTQASPMPSSERHAALMGSIAHLRATSVAMNPSSPPPHTHVPVSDTHRTNENTPLSTHDHVPVNHLTPRDVMLITARAAERRRLRLEAEAAKQSSDPQRRSTPSLRRPDSVDPGKRAGPIGRGNAPLLADYRHFDTDLGVSAERESTVSTSRHALYPSHQITASSGRWSSSIGYNSAPSPFMAPSNSHERDVPVLSISSFEAAAQPFGHRSSWSLAGSVAEDVRGRSSIKPSPQLSGRVSVPRSQFEALSEGSREYLTELGFVEVLDHSPV